MTEGCKVSFSGIKTEGSKGGGKVRADTLEILRGVRFP